MAWPRISRARPETGSMRRLRWERAGGFCAVETRAGTDKSAVVEPAIFTTPKPFFGYPRIPCQMTKVLFWYRWVELWRLFSFRPVTERTQVTFSSD